MGTARHRQVRAAAIIDLLQLGAPNTSRSAPPEGGTPLEVPAPTAWTRCSLQEPSSTHSAGMLESVATLSLPPHSSRNLAPTTWSRERSDDPKVTFAFASSAIAG